MHDEPQHVFMGKITEPIFDVLGVEHSCISKDTTAEELHEIMLKAGKTLKSEKQYAIIIKKDTFQARQSEPYTNNYKLVREQAIAGIIRSLDPDDVIISTTGKISREVYEQSDIINGNHKQAFLTVGGMGHASMIAYGYASSRPDKKVYCIDGDGAELMHMGALSFIGSHKTDNLVHICINNAAHESVGGMPTGAAGMSYAGIAKACGYDLVLTASTEKELEEALAKVHGFNGTAYLEIFVSMQSRADLGRPKESARQNRINFMEYQEVR